MGTAAFAVPSLDILVENRYRPVAVVTAPDRPAGRGQKIRFSPVKEAALKYSIPVLQPGNLKDPQFLDQLKQFDPGLQVVVAFRMLPTQVWQMPKNGTFNLHASLLPQYRGAAPINHAIINGETQTGVTTFFIDDKIDTGSIILSEKTTIGDKENAGQLHNRLMLIGAGLVLKTVKVIESGNYTLTSQSEYIRPGETLKPAPKIFREDCLINWKQSAEQIHDFVRGLSPHPAAYLFMHLGNDKKVQVKVFEVFPHKAKDSDDITPGHFESDGKTYFHIFCSDGYISVNELQMEGKKRMSVKEFLKGFEINRLNRIS